MYLKSRNGLCWDWMRSKILGEENWENRIKKIIIKCNLRKFRRAGDFMLKSHVTPGQFFGNRMTTGIRCEV